MCRWIEANLVHGEGDFYGRPFKLQPEQKAFIYRCYEQNPDGSRKHKRALKGMPKGNGKTELVAAIALAELAGPTGFPDGHVQPSPDIPVGAASFEQANLLFSAAKIMVSEGKLKPYLDVFDTEILRKDGPGRMYRVAAAAGTNDGRRPSFFCADELHEWTGRKERVHLVLANGLSKRAEGWELDITTAGADLESLCGRLYQYGRRIESGEITDPQFLFDWQEAPEDCDLTTDEGLRAAIKVCNPAADVFWPIDNIVARFHQIPEFEFRRYHLNQWTRTGESWLPVGAWDACEGDAAIPDGAEVFVGVDMALYHDSTAIVVAHVRDDGRIAVQANVWEADGERIDHLAVMQHLRELTHRYSVRVITYDPRFMEVPAQMLLDEGLPMLKFDQSPERMVPACGNAFDLIVGNRLVHDGGATLTDHVLSAAQRETDRGWSLSKGKSKRKIDACIAMVIALWEATQLEPAEESPNLW